MIPKADRKTARGLDLIRFILRQPGWLMRILRLCCFDTSAGGTQHQAALRPLQPCSSSAYLCRPRARRKTILLKTTYQPLAHHAEKFSYFHKTFQKISARCIDLGEFELRL